MVRSLRIAGDRLGRQVGAGGDDQVVVRIARAIGHLDDMARAVDPLSLANHQVDPAAEQAPLGALPALRGRPAEWHIQPARLVHVPAGAVDYRHMSLASAEFADEQIGDERAANAAAQDQDLARSGHAYAPCHCQ
jgi:hypothetical protein